MIERRRKERADRSAAFHQLVAFGVGQEEYGVDIMRLREIIQPLPITMVPRAPSFIEGIIELRGAIIPILDLRKRFGVASTAVDRSGKYLIVAMEVGGQRMIVGLVVDRVREPIYVKDADVRPAPVLAQAAGGFFSGVVHHAQRILMVVAVDSLLSPTEKATLAALGTA